MAAYKELIIRVPAGVLAWLESEATIINADLQALGQRGSVTPGDVATTLMERGIAATLAHGDMREHEASQARESAVSA